MHCVKYLIEKLGGDTVFLQVFKQIIWNVSPIVTDFLAPAERVTHGWFDVTGENFVFLTILKSNNENQVQIRSLTWNLREIRPPPVSFSMKATLVFLMQVGSTISKNMPLLRPSIFNSSSVVFWKSRGYVGLPWRFSMMYLFQSRCNKNEKNNP